MGVPIPLFIKEPLAVFLQGCRDLPLPVALTRARTVFAEDIHLNQNKKKRIYRCHQKAVKQYLEKRYHSFWISEPEEESEANIPGGGFWFFWWQGLDDAPELVRLCYRQLKRMARAYPVIEITEANFQEYVDLPDYILEKQRSGCITLTHFSDILRMNLLARHGGFWMDASIYCSAFITEEIFQAPVFTGKNPGGDWINVSNWNWTGYMLATWKNSPLPVMMSRFFDVYWKQENRMIDYYLIDYAVALLCEYHPAIRKALEDIQRNNTRQHDLMSMLSVAYDRETVDELLYHSDTTFHKLSWKATFPDVDAEGRQTTYGYLKNCEHVSGSR